MPERRYDEAEVGAIFEKATEAQLTPRQQFPSREGMTLRELQDIGREVGIDPQLVARAAQSIERVGRPGSRRFLGLPIGVSRTIDLGRKFTDDEWERLVVDLRETFDARGVVRTEGSLRSWSNGNLQALLEPTATGHRLRLRTVKGDARGMIVGGLAMLALSLTGMLFSLSGSAIADPGQWSAMTLLGAGGAAMFGIGALRLPGWARLRRRQMEEIAARLPETNDRLPSSDR